SPARRRHRAADDPQHRQARLSALRSPPRHLRQAGRAGAGPTARAHDAVELPRADLPRVQRAGAPPRRVRCAPGPVGAPVRPARAVGITRPRGGGRLDADYNAVPPCIAPDQPTTIGVSRFQSSLVRAGRPWSDAFLQASVPGQPVHARRGGVLRFRVLLRNRSRTTARFDRCPAYIQQLAPAGRVEAYLLNCPAAHSVRPGKSRAFAMRLAVRRSAPLGANGLFWALDPLGARAPQLHAWVTIEQ